MPHYIRNRVAGGTYFFTVNLHDRSSDLLVTHINLRRTSIAAARKLHLFHIDAWVVLPDHLHCIWTLPPGDENYPIRWWEIKRRFARGLNADEPRTVTMNKRRERGIWQRRYWEHTIRNERDYAAHIDYVHFNPVKHGLVQNAADWPYSTFKKAVEEGFYPTEWSVGGEFEGEFGER